MKKHLPTITIFIIIIGVIALGIWYSDKDSPIKELAKLDVYSEEELSFLEEQGFLNDINSENLPSNKEQIVSLLKSPGLIEQNLNSPDESFEVLATKLDKDNNSYQLAFKLENKSNQSKEFYLIPISESSQTEFKEIKGSIKGDPLSVKDGERVSDTPLAELYDVNKHKQELRPELAQAYDDIENNGYTGKPIKLVLEANSTLLAQSKWKISRGPTSDSLKPVYLLVYGSAGGAVDELYKDISFEQLDKVEKEIGIYRITFDEYSDVEIKDQDMPEVKLRKWGDETYIKVSYPDFTSVNPKQDKGKMKWINGNKEVHFYPLEPREYEENGRIVKQLEKGGFEFEIILKEKPVSNKMVLDIETKGLRFSYQPELTQKEIEMGAFRPENVIGSYAVYHETQTKFFKTKEEGDKYKAGIAFHIYRPKIIDSNGWEVWGELNINEKAGTLTVEMPQDFVDNAVYPIRHAAGLTIGYTVGGSGSAFGNPGFALATHTGVSPDNSAGTVTELKISTTSHETYALKVGVYTESGSDTPNSLIDNSSSTFIPSNKDEDGFYDAGISGFDITENTRYWLAFISSNVNQGVYYNTDVVSPKWNYYTAEAYADWMKNTFPGGGSTVDWRFSIYATYTPPAAAEAALTGTAVPTITETDIVTGGKTIIITLTGDTWVTAGETFDAQRQNIINGMDSAQSEGTGWDAEVKANQGVNGVVRTSDTVVTVTLDAQATYNITATETITVTVPGTALTGGEALIATPTVTVAAKRIIIKGGFKVKGGLKVKF